MTLGRPIKFDSERFTKTRANVRSSPGYSSRRAQTVFSRRNLNGLSASRRAIIPASQEEYITSLSGAPPQLSRHFAAMPAGSRHIFGSKLRELKNADKEQLKKSLPGVVTLLVLLVSVLGLAGLRSGESAEAELWRTRSSIEAIVDENSEISERRPSNMQSYQVAGDLPRFLRIKGMGLSSRVRRVGVGTKTELKLPSNIYDAGWYESSVKPGEPGAVVLTGHFSGPTKPGIFHDLTQLESGDELELEIGSGEVYYYYVAKLEAYSISAALDPLLASAVPGRPGLNLITEIGKFDNKANSFDQRLVVFAVQKDKTGTASNARADENNNTR